MTPAGTTPADLLCPTARATSWADLADLLSDDWLSVRDGRGRCLIRLADGLGLVEQPGLLRARERRALHRCGFRLQRADGVRVWVWAPPDDPPRDPRDLAASLRRWQQRSAAVRDQALRAVREVLRADVSVVSVVLLPPEQDDPSDDWWDDCTCGDCTSSACPGGGAGPCDG
jgi:hypothetical protein